MAGTNEIAANSNPIRAIPVNQINDQPMSASCLSRHKGIWKPVLQAAAMIAGVLSAATGGYAIYFGTITVLGMVISGPVGWGLLVVGIALITAVVANSTQECHERRYLEEAEQWFQEYREIQSWPEKQLTIKRALSVISDSEWSNKLPPGAPLPLRKQKEDAGWYIDGFTPALPPGPSEPPLPPPTGLLGVPHSERDRIESLIQIRAAIEYPKIPFMRPHRRIEPSISPFTASGSFGISTQSMPRQSTSSEERSSPIERSPTISDSNPSDSNESTKLLDSSEKYLLVTPLTSELDIE